MMDDVPGSANVKVRLFQVYHNERYSPVSSWSSKSLFPNDRSAFTTVDDVDGFKDINEVNDALLMKGWRWLSDDHWQIDMSPSNIDDEGWSYAVNFGEFKDQTCGSGKKALTTFVRRKKLTRIQSFDVLCPEVESFTCSYCDLQEVEQLYELLLDKLGEASAYRHPTKNSHVKTIALKNKMLTSLFDESTDNISNVAVGASVTYHISTIDLKLDLFVKESKSSWSSAVSSMLLSGESIVDVARQRRAEYSTNYFPVDEGHEICRLIIRKFDINHNYHCNEITCGRLCPFSYDTCPHSGCSFMYSRKWTLKHDAECGHKLISCPRDCGDVTKRLFMDSHLHNVCPLRIVKCPLFEFGCLAEVCAKDLNDHVQNAIGDHMAIVMTKLSEIQNVMIIHNNQIKDLQTTTNNHSTALVGLTSAVTANTVNMKESDRKLEQLVHDNYKSLNNKISRNDSDILKTRNDLAQLKQQLITPK